MLNSNKHSGPEGIPEPGDIQGTIRALFGGKIRLRACGLLQTEAGILLIRHEGLGTNGYLWAPPGGKPDFKETAPQAARREFEEETGLQTTCGRFLCINEYLAPPLHAIELFFEMHLTGGHLRPGHDPELAPNGQMLGEARFFSREELAQTDPETLHSLFRKPLPPEGITGLSGYFFG